MSGVTVSDLINMKLAEFYDYRAMIRMRESELESWVRYVAFLMLAGFVLYAFRVKVDALKYALVAIVIIGVSGGGMIVRGDVLINRVAPSARALEDQFNALSRTIEGVSPELKALLEFLGWERHNKPRLSWGVKAIGVTDLIGGVAIIAMFAIANYILRQIMYVPWFFWGSWTVMVAEILAIAFMKKIAT